MNVQSRRAALGIFVCCTLITQAATIEPFVRRFAPPARFLRGFARVDSEICESCLQTAVLPRILVVRECKKLHIRICWLPSVRKGLRHFGV